jgi:cysteine desulfurase family protein (TIGR01976 family)
MKPEIFSMDQIRARFPALQETDNEGRPYVYFDGPGGTQVPMDVTRAMSEYFRKANANQGGRFATSRRNDEMLASAREAMADFLNAASPQEIVFGANMTSLTFNMSRAIGRHLQPGDEIVVTRLDHDANIAPWKALEEKGVVIRWVDFDPGDCCLDLNDMSSQINAKTKLVAVGYASNAVGTINPIKKIAAIAHAVGAWLWVDAVHYAPHGPIDVQKLDCDLLVLSAYKFFGPHVGILYGKLDLLDQLKAYKVRPAKPTPPYKFETGTQNHEGLAGLVAAIDYVSELSQNFSNLQNEFDLASMDSYKGRRRHLKQAMTLVAAYERELFAAMISGMLEIEGVRVYGITDSNRLTERCPTLAFTMSQATPAQVATYLGDHGIFVWDGNYYAISVTERLGLETSGGMVRVGLAHYNTSDEVERFLIRLSRIAEGNSSIQ